MPGLILAAVNPDNTPHGYNWTFAFPMVLFIVIALLLYALFSRPHRRVPGRPISATSTGSQVPDADAARAAAVAGGLSLAAGGGTTESAHEPTGAHVTANEPTSEPGGAHLTGSVNPEDTAVSEAPEGAESGDGTEAKE